MKKEYESAELEIIVFTEEDVIEGSPGDQADHKTFIESGDIL